MKIGIFDSGLGGLLVLKGIIKKLPQYDYVYLGDVKRIPYGNRSNTVVYQFTRDAVDYLFRKKNCCLVILACNTATAGALKRIQREYLPENFPERRVLGVIFPTVEAVVSDQGIKRVGLLATPGTINSGVFAREFKKLAPSLALYSKSAPLLVPLIENGGTKWTSPILKEYLRPLARRKPDAIILGCTHYPLLKHKVKRFFGTGVKVICQDEVVPEKLAEYLTNHPELDRWLTRKKKREFLVTDITPSFASISRQWFGKKIKLKLVDY